MKYTTKKYIHPDNDYSFMDGSEVWDYLVMDGDIPVLDVIRGGKAMAEKVACLLTHEQAIIRVLTDMAFTIEAVAHLQGREKEMLPLAELGRAAVAILRGDIKEN